MRDYSNLKLFGKKIKSSDPEQVKLIDVIPVYPKSSLTFIEVGANDGSQNDPIHSFIVNNKWTGILIEPIPSSFRKLVNNYKGINGLIFEQVAICGNSEAIMYLPKQSSITSFNKKHPPAKGKGKPISVEGVRLSQIIDKHKFYNVDLLTIDAEGYDFEVIKTVDFNKCTPKIIHYEHRHLEQQKKECELFLQNIGYSLYFNKNNTVAIIDC